MEHLVKLLLLFFTSYTAANEALIINPNSCKNGRLDHFNNCICDDGYKGDFCETAVCKVPCMNGGFCIIPNGDWCYCNKGYMGIYCEIPVCKPVCMNGGLCTAPNQCSCTEGYKGRSCETPDCKPPCNNGGYCSADNGRQCICPDGYKGTSCETRYEEPPKKDNISPVAGYTQPSRGNPLKPNTTSHSNVKKQAAILGDTYDKYYEYTFLFLSIMGSILGALIIRFCGCCICQTIQSYKKKNGSWYVNNKKEEHEVNTLSIEVNQGVSATPSKDTKISDINASPYHIKPLPSEVNQAASAPVEECPPVFQEIVLHQRKKSAPTPPYTVGERLSSFSEIYSPQSLGPQMYNSQPSAPMYAPGSYGEHPPSYIQTLAQDINHGSLPYCIQPFVPQMYGSPIYSPGLHGGILPSFSEILAQDVYQGQLSKEDLQIVQL